MLIQWPVARSLCNYYLKGYTMKNTVLELRGRFYKIEQDIKKYIKQASKAKNMQVAMVTEVRIVGLEQIRKAISNLLRLAEHEAKQMKKDFNRKPYSQRS